MIGKWPVYSAEKIGYFASIASFYAMLMLRYPLMAFLNGLILVCAYLSVKRPVVTYGQVFNGLRLSKE